MKQIPDALYRQIVELMPILCVDLVIAHEGKYLLVKRKNEPVKGLWWPPGGRVWKGETIEKAARRKAKEEIGVHVRVIAPVGYYEDSWSESAFGKGKDTATLSIVVLASTNSLKFRVDEQSASWKWSRQLPKRFVIKPFGVFKK